MSGAFGVAGVEQHQVLARLGCAMIAVSRVKITDLVGCAGIRHMAYRPFHVVQRRLAIAYQLDLRRLEEGHREKAGQLHPVAGEPM